MLHPTSRIAGLALAALTLLTPVAARQAAAPSYTMVATLPSIIDGTGVRSLRYDATRNRLYTAVQSGLFWVDLSEKTPRVKGPFVRKNIVKIEFAPEVEKIFYMTADEVGYADLDRFGESKTLKGDLTPIDIVYEPTRKELYVATRDQRLIVFDGVSGRAGDDVPLRDGSRPQLEAIPGRVFVLAGGQARAVRDRRRDAPDRGVARDGTTLHAGVPRSRSGRRVPVRDLLPRVRRDRHQTRRRHRQRRHADGSVHRVRSRRASS